MRFKRTHKRNFFIEKSNLILMPGDDEVKQFQKSFEIILKTISGLFAKIKEVSPLKGTEYTKESEFNIIPF